MASQQQISWNDGILLVSLLYSALDLMTEWSTFQTCHRPIHWWLIVSYACVVGFRLTHLVGGCLAQVGGGDEFLLDLRQKGGLPKALLAFTWLVCLPCFVLSTFVGSVWLYDVVHYSPTCVPSAFHLWFAGFWLLLCYASVFVYAALGAAAWIIERRIRGAERDLQEIAGDSDATARWGDVGSSAGYRSFSTMSDKGLTPTQIKALPGEAVLGASGLGGPEAECGGCYRSLLQCCGEDCTICINTLRHGDSVRQLATCGHVFHRSCIDLWLLRRADCPLCKRGVLTGGESGGTQPV